MRCALLLGLLVSGISAVAHGEAVQKPVTVIFQDQATKIDKAQVDEGQLWVAFDDVQRVNGFEPKPEGLCAGDICVPIPPDADWVRKHGEEQYLNATQFATKVNQVVAVDEAGDVWSFGNVPDVVSQLLPQGTAPDFALPDRTGKAVKLSDFRGKKVLILTWASW